MKKQHTVPFYAFLLPLLTQKLCRILITIFNIFNAERLYLERLQYVLNLLTHSSAIFSHVDDAQNRSALQAHSRQIFLAYMSATYLFTTLPAASCQSKSLYGKQLLLIIHKFHNIFQWHYKCVWFQSRIHAWFSLPVFKRINI